MIMGKRDIIPSFPSLIQPVACIFSATVHDTSSVFQSELHLSYIPGICRHPPWYHLSEYKRLATDSLFTTFNLELSKFSIPFSIKKARAGRRKIWKTLASLDSSITYYRQMKATSGGEEWAEGHPTLPTAMHHHLSQNPVPGTWQRRGKGNHQVLRVPILCNYMSDSNFFLTFLMDNGKILYEGTPLK